MKNKIHFTIVAAFFISFGGCYAASAATVAFEDDFNRPDSATVGNGWINASGNINGNLEIASGELTSEVTTGGAATIYRPLPFAATTTISADVKEMNGFGGVPGRYDTGFFIINNGSNQNGYGILIGRSDSNSNNSSVLLVDNGTVVEALPSSFQYGSEIHIVSTFGLDGSVTGSISQSGSTFDFSFPPRAIQSTGDNLGIFMEFADSRTTDFIFPRVDNLVISSDAIPVRIDIKPESSLNSINPANSGVIPVAILSTPTFDATSVDPSTVRFGPNNATALNGKGHLEDVNQDGSLDMMFQFKTQDTGIQCGDIAAQLSGQTTGGEMFSATDSVNSVSCN